MRVAAISSAALVALVLVAGAALLPTTTAQPIGPECPPYYNPFCCKGQFQNGECVCWSEQIFGPNCNYECRPDLCNTHGVCNQASNPQVDEEGNVISGVCVCDGSGEWFGDRCTGFQGNPTCNDKVKNGAETGVDCGGGACPKCGGGQGCTTNSDCQSGSCVNGVCTDATCSDGAKNGQETDIDCGGGTCPKCTEGKTCLVNSDCLSGQCQSGQCVGDGTPPTWTSPTPVATTTDKSASVDLQINEPGTVFMCLLPNNSPQPSVNDVVNGQSGGTVISAEQVQLPSPTTITRFQIPVVLSPSTEYDLYLVAADDRSPTPNYQLSVIKLDVTTKASDVYPPKFWALFPRLKTAGDTSATFEAALNEPGTVYYVVSTPGTATPTASAVKSGSVSNVATGTIPVTAAWNVFEQTSSGLATNTAYKAFFAAEDSGGRLQDDVVTIEFSTSSDKTPPLFINPYPTVTGATSSGFTVTTQLDEPGWFYTVVLPVGAPAPSSLQVIQGVDGDGTVAVAHSSSQVQTASSSVAVAITDLADSTTYDVWVVASDALVNVQAAPVKRSGTTLADTSPPGWKASYPSITGITSHSATVNVQLDEPGKCYSVAVLSGATAPTPAQVKAGYSGTAVASTTVSVPKSSTTYFGVFTGLSASTSYDVYSVCEDDTATPNIQSAVVQRSFSTPADTFAPAFVSPSPSIISADHQSGTVEVILDDPGTVFYVVVLRGAAAPTSANVKAGVGASGAAAPASKGSFSVSQVLVKRSQVMTGLTKLTEYDVYLVTEDASNNLLDTPRKLEFATTDINDVTAPNYSPTYPKIHTPTTQGGTLAVRLTELGQVFYVVTLHNATAPQPTGSQIIGQLDMYNGAPITSGSMVVTTVGATFSEVITGVPSDTRVDVWVVARDNQSPPNVGEVVQLDLTTLAAQSCSDNTKNNAESDVDCGGGACPKCTNGKTCNSNTDCASNVCTGGTCVANACSDGVKDNDETDIDCGGATCSARCNNGKQCLINSDCASFNCVTNVCQPAACTPCNSDEVTLVACTANTAAQCKAKPPTFNEDTSNGSKNVVTVSPQTTGSYIIATRNCVTPTCSMSSSSTTFDDGGVVKVIQTPVSSAATFNLFTSSIVRAVACKAGSEQSEEVVLVSKVGGGEVTVASSTTLFIRAIADFGTTRRLAFRESVAKTVDVALADVAIVSAVATPGSTTDSTDVAYKVAFPSSTTEEALYHCSMLSARINNVESNSTLRSELLARDVIVDGSVTNDDFNNNGGGGAQETNTTPALFDFENGWAWLWWLIPLLILLCICCCLLLCCLRKREKDEYSKRRNSGFGSHHAIVPGGHANRVAPSPSVSSGEDDDAQEMDVMLANAPQVRHAARGRGGFDADDDGIQRSANGGYANGGYANGGYANGGGEEEEAMMDLTTVVQRGEVITTTIETKGDPVFEHEGGSSGMASVSRVQGVPLPGMGHASAVGSSAMSSMHSVHSVHRTVSGYDDGSRPVGLDDLNALNIRALSFARNTPGAGGASHHNLNRHGTSNSSGSVASGLRVWANN